MCFVLFFMRRNSEGDLLKAFGGNVVQHCLNICRKKSREESESMDEKEWRNSTRNKSTSHKLEERAQR